jgi:hypothetical protein
MNPNATLVTAFTVPTDCNCVFQGVTGTRFNCSVCAWGTPAVSAPALKWVDCCAYNCPGQCGPKGATAGCRDNCISAASLVCYDLCNQKNGGICNNINCDGDQLMCEQVVLSSNRTWPLPAQCPTTTKLSPTPMPTPVPPTPFPTPATTTHAPTPLPTPPTTTSACTSCSITFGAVGAAQWCKVRASRLSALTSLVCSVAR